MHSALQNLVTPNLLQKIVGGILIKLLVMRNGCFGLFTDM